jgi:hydroxymethylbilane synthase
MTIRDDQQRPRTRATPAATGRGFTGARRLAGVTRSPNTLRLGTRGSLLAVTQSQWVADEIHRARPDVRVELAVIKTTGDLVRDRPLHDLGGKGLFTKEIELALIAGEIDLAVHSYKDVPVTEPLVDESGLVIAAVPRREDARDVLVAGGATLEQLKPGATVGTGSLRRQCLVQTVRPELDVRPLRGNVDTRLRRQKAGDFDAVILAAAGLIRAGLFDPSTMVLLPVEQFVPSAGQGALAVQCRAEDARTRKVIGILDDPATRRCVDAERAVIRALNADCKSPVGVHARITAAGLEILTAVAGDGGVLPVQFHCDLIALSPQ